MIGALLLLGCAASAQDEALAQREEIPPHYAMDYGPFLSGTIAGRDSEENVTLKGIAIRLGEGEDRGAVLFDTELLRMSAGWVGDFLELRGTPYDGSHGPVPRVRGREVFATRPGPGWAHDGSFADPRAIPHGPLPRERGRYRGLYLHGDRVVLAYDVAGGEVRELPSLVRDGDVRAIARTLNLGPCASARTMVVCERAQTTAAMHEGVATLQRLVEEETRRDLRTVDVQRRAMVTAVALVGAPPGAALRASEGRIVLDLPASTKATRCKIVLWDGEEHELARFSALLPTVGAPEDLTPFLAGGPPRWQPLTTRGERGADDGPYAVDTATVPENNPWHSRLRLGAFDFFADGRAALSTWNGDVWIVDGLDDDLAELTWTRFATGLFDPLGLKIVDGVVHTLGRDQITKLHDRNGDGEADFYECFNNDVLITASFHEFAFDLQTDAAGSFYFSKGGPVRPGGRGFDKIVPHHGCVLKVDKDGERLEVYATGLRAPNGIGVSPQGVVTSGDNEGTWTPRCRINWMHRGSFNGCVDLAHSDPRPERYDEPLCFLPMDVDNSGGSQVWVTSERWGPFTGELLHLSYGQCAVYAVLRQHDGDRVQGGVARFPVDFASSCMRGRFHPIDGQLWICGFQGWQTRAAKMTAFQRVRWTGRKVYMPRKLEVRHGGIAITFTEPLDPQTAHDPESFDVQRWNYLWTERYGSPEISISERDADLEKIGKDNWNSFSHREPVAVASATLESDGRTVFLAIPGLEPVMQMRIGYNLDAADGELVKGDIHHTIHWVPER